MEKHIDRERLIPDRSYAFRKNFSTTMCINELINVVQYHRGEKHKLVAACLDISKAYDFVNTNKLERKLRNMGFNEKLIAWIVSYLNDRTLILGHAERKIAEGLAQGSGLSPLLFNLYTADLHKLEDENCYIFQFADDFFLLVFDNTWDDAKLRLQTKIADFVTQCRTLNLKINLEKTNVTTFGKRGAQVNIIVEGTQIQEVRQICYLGRVISSNNSIMPHVDKIVEKVNRTSFFLNAISGCTYGIDPKRALIFYKAFIRSKIEYAASSFANISKTALAKLQSTNNAHLRRALGLIRSTPVHVIYHLAGELPTKYRLQLATVGIGEGHPIGTCNSRIVLLEKTFDTSYHKTYCKYKDVLSNLEPLRGMQMESSKLKLVGDFHNAGKREMNTEMVGQIFKEKFHNLKSKGMDIIFTDGSVKGDHSGGAFYQPRSGTTRLFRLTQNLSSMSMELLMIEKAVEFANTQRIDKLVIFTDSRSGILAFNSLKKNQICERIRKAIIDAKSLTNIEIHYIPSHLGIPGNELVDEAAKKAVNEGQILQVKWTREEAIREIESRIWKEWEREYTDLSRLKGRQYYRIFPGMNTKPWFSDKSLKLNPIQIKQLNRIISGHSFSPHSLQMTIHISYSTVLSTTSRGRTFLCLNDTIASPNFLAKEV
ncbi:uncharacterized protein LOC124419265 [Lucilia cuprina]|uniref:uncharacterized protein LOC124419265 n=1 Tax=Lucilia cuprina TaxID=7375 RepID=UPI001F05C050|nr:uncharacterized protein LOC124419265 [Lucilia cuprina]